VSSGKTSKPHGQVRNDLDMDKVLLVQLNSSREAMVNGGQTVVQHKSPTISRICFPTCEGLQGCMAIPKSLGSVATYKLTHDKNLISTVDRFNILGNQYAKSMDVVFYVFPVHAILQENSYVNFVINNAFL